MEHLGPRLQANATCIGKLSHCNGVAEQIGNLSALGQMGHTFVPSCEKEWSIRGIYM